MRVPLSWLKEFVDISVPAPELAERLTVAGAEVSKLDYVGLEPPPLHPSPAAEEGVGLVWERDKIVVGQIVEVLPHPNADRLVLADILYTAPLSRQEPAASSLIAARCDDAGEGVGVHRVVTGAPNIFYLKGQGKLANGPKVVFAMEGARLYDGHAEGQKLMTLKASKIRGVPSNAMVCSEKELGLSEEHEGIIILDPEAPVGMPLADYMGDVVLHIEILPNIARCQSIIGVAREVAALSGVQFKGTEGKFTSRQRLSPAPSTDWVRIEIADPDLCPRYSAALIRNVQIGPSPEWMQRRLKLAGVRPINNVVDITNYVMLEWGQPLHAFDYDKLVQRTEDGGRRTEDASVTRPPSPIPTIIIRRAHPGEHMTTLDGVDRALANDMLMIADTAGAIGVAGVMGGAQTEIDDHTKNVLLEAASFNFINNRKTAAVLKLPSEATARFGRGVPPAHTIPAAQRAAELMQQLAHGAVEPAIADAYPGKQPPTIITFDTHEVKRLLGIDVPVERMTSILQSLDFKVKGTESSSMVLQVTVPEHRLDIAIPADLVEEVARIIGYDQIAPTLMNDELPPQRRNVELEAEDKIRDSMVGAGLQEVISYTLTTIEREALLYPDPSQADIDEATYVTIANPISPERKVMRHTGMASLLDILRDALRYRERALLFEIGRTYLQQPQNILPAEPKRLTIALAGTREPHAWLTKESGRLDFFDLKGIVDTLAHRLNLPDVGYGLSEHPTLHPARAATLRSGDRLIGVFGEVHPLVREHFDLPVEPVCLAEFDLEALLAQMALPHFQPISRFPAVREDIAVIVAEDTPATAVEAVIWEAGGSLLRSAMLFDLYRGAQIGAGKKSLAYALSYQHAERTLTDDEAARVRGRIVKKLRDTFGAELRG